MTRRLTNRDCIAAVLSARFELETYVSGTALDESRCEAGYHRTVGHTTLYIPSPSADEGKSMGEVALTA